MRNNKGILPVVLAFYIAWGVVAGTAAWHIPAWSKAKSQGDDAKRIYQAQQMWPQQVFGKPNTAITYVKGNGGNFEGGVYTPEK